MEIATKTDIGNVRKINQDYISSYVKDDELIAVVCDGMGGHKAGEIASFMTASHIAYQFEMHDEFKEFEIEEWIKTVINEASELVRKESFRSDEYTGMGTTVVVALIKNKKAYICHIGDSRAYYICDNNIIQLTKDDTLVNALLEMGSISQEAAKDHPKRNVLLQAVGVNENLKISFKEIELDKGILLICTDGLYNSLDDEQILEILNKENDINMLSEELMSSAIKNGGNDNIGFAIIKNKGDVQ